MCPRAAGKQVEYGKVTHGYKCYLHVCPRDKRRKGARAAGLNIPPSLFFIHMPFHDPRF